MHHRCEVIFPPVDDVEQTVGQILAPFYEGRVDDDGDDGHLAKHAFWDWWVLGGRFSGGKLQAVLDPERLGVFDTRMRAMEVTVSGLVAGKDSLEPETQIPVVDALWQELFPEYGDIPCPFFAHSEGRLNTSKLFPADVCRLDQVPESYTSARLVVASVSFDHDTGTHTGPLQAKYMLSKDLWNGLNHQDAVWQGNVLKGVEMYRKQLERYKEEYRAVALPQPDWLSVTVDYHT